MPASVNCLVHRGDFEPRPGRYAAVPVHIGHAIVGGEDGAMTPQDQEGQAGDMVSPHCSTDILRDARARGILPGQGVRQKKGEREELSDPTV